MEYLPILVVVIVVIGIALSVKAGPKTEYSNNPGDHRRPDEKADSATKQAYFLNYGYIVNRDFTVITDSNYATCKDCGGTMKPRLIERKNYYKNNSGEIGYEQLGCPDISGPLLAICSSCDMGMVASYSAGHYSVESTGAGPWLHAEWRFWAMSPWCLENTLRLMSNDADSVDPRVVSIVTTGHVIVERYRGQVIAMDSIQNYQMPDTTVLVQCQNCFESIDGRSKICKHCHSPHTPIEPTPPNRKLCEKCEYYFVGLDEKLCAVCQGVPDWSENIDVHLDYPTEAIQQYFRSWKDKI